MTSCCSRLYRVPIDDIFRRRRCRRTDCDRGIAVKGCRRRRRCCSSIAIDGPDSIAGVSGLRWGSVEMKGEREEMEDEVVVIQSDGFAYAAVFDGHAGVSSVNFLRDELYGECMAALQGGRLLIERDFGRIKKALEEAFLNADERLLQRYDDGDDDSGSTVTAIFVLNDVMFISHVGDSSAVLSRSGKPFVLTESHRPYGKAAAAIREIKRVKELGGWISDGRICGDISVSRSFGDIRFKRRREEMLKKGVSEGRWSEKFASRVRFKGDLVTALPDVREVGVAAAECEFVILGSDGLWDYVTGADAVGLVRSELRKHGDVQAACEAVARMALERGSQDNVSVVVADFGRTQWQNPNASPEEEYDEGRERAAAVTIGGLASLGIGAWWWWWISTSL
ncbi:hypothetical protein M569_12759 [Genlisea aurea]|uniref:protein-serine/threonine phosphatase n=1 Tax=Genlisea aurea TaxID=192259 RepID=S8DGU0_9LAMI|nr:hypothetical protein M569_12759 [Genlisea aurea]